MARPATKRRFWTLADEDIMRSAYATEPTAVLATLLRRTEKQVLCKANCMGLKKTHAYISAVARARSAAAGHGGHATQFTAGTQPWNKGQRGLTGTQDACKPTQFKPGSRPHTWMPVGSHTINADGMLDRKVNDGPGPRHRCWSPVHRLVWEAAHGPVPVGHLVVFKAGRRTAQLELITLDALECITRAENMRRNSIRQHPPELVDLMRLRGTLKRAINSKAKEAETHE